MTKDSVQQKVRQRDRFLCQYCGAPGEQYAHIIPDSDDGKYSLNNLLFLCYRHHRELEAKGTPPETRKRLIALAEALRDKPKSDGLLSHIFVWPAGKDIIVELGGGFNFINQPRILERHEKDDPYLSLYVDELGVLKVNASFEDEDGEVFMTIKENELLLPTQEAWDVRMRPRWLAFEHTRRKIRLELFQREGGELVVMGNLYLNGQYFQISQNSIEGAGMYMSGNSSHAMPHGLTVGKGIFIL